MEPGGASLLPAPAPALLRLRLPPPARGRGALARPTQERAPPRPAKAVSAPGSQCRMSIAWSIRTAAASCSRASSRRPVRAASAPQVETAQGLERTHAEGLGSLERALAMPHGRVRIRGRGRFTQHAERPRRVASLLLLGGEPVRVLRGGTRRSSDGSAGSACDSGRRPAGSNPRRYGFRRSSAASSRRRCAAASSVTCSSSSRPDRGPSGPSMSRSSSRGPAPSNQPPTRPRTSAP